MDSNQICTNMDNIFRVAINTTFVFSQRGLPCGIKKYAVLNSGRKMQQKVHLEIIRAECFI